jgi:hypothetical protein
MKETIFTIACLLLVGFFPATALADDDFDGIIESRPMGKAGTWVVGGRSVNVTDQTRLEEEDGPLTVGTCAEVEIADGVAVEIEREPLHKCGK